MNYHFNFQVQLMRLKGRAIGCKGIPTENRRYFLIYPPLSSPKKESRAIYVCYQWTVGKAIDSIAEILGIRNSNNMANAEKLRIFHHYNGNILVDKVDIVLSDLFNNNTLVDGQNLILEYSNADKIDSSLYKINIFHSYLYFKIIKYLVKIENTFLNILLN